MLSKMQDIQILQYFGSPSVYIRPKQEITFIYL